MSKFTIEHIEYVLGEEKIDVIDLVPDGIKTIERTGIKSVFETSFSQEELGLAAARKVMQKTEASPDVLIYVTQSPKFILPSSGVLVHNALGLRTDCLLFDINAGCSGFAQALFLASQLISTYDQILIICSDTYRKKLDPADRSTNAVFSDAASAILITSKPSIEISNLKSRVDGSGSIFLYQPYMNVETGESGKIRMSGRDLWSFTRTCILPDIEELISKLDCNAVSLDSIFIHQASKVVVDGIGEHLSRSELVQKNYMNVGNCVSSSIPILIKESNFKINESNSIVSGFGVGLMAMTFALTKE